MSLKQIGVLVGLAVIAVAVAYFTCGIGYVLAVTATLVFAWLVTFKMLMTGLAKISAWIVAALEPKSKDVPTA